MRTFVLLVTLAITIVDAHAARRRAIGIRTRGPELEIVPLAGFDPTIGTTGDLAPLGRVIGDAPIVALGESYHTSAGFYQMKDRIFRYLVAEKGFRAFAIESYWQGAERANAYIRSCAGTARAAISEHINVWQSTEYADMVEWMCEWNRGHPAPADQLTLFGFDIQQPWLDGPALQEFLGFIGIPPAHPWADGLRSCEAAFGLRHPFGQIPLERHTTCIDALNAIEEHLEANRAAIIAQTSQDAFAIAMLRTIGLRGWQISVYIIAHDFAAGYNARDEAMAYAFHVMRARKAPDAKTVVWAANSHVAQNRLPRGEQSIGSHLAATFGEDYVTFALTAFETEIDFPGYPCGLVTRAAGSVEERLAEFGHEALLAVPTERASREVVLPMGLDLVRPYADYDGIIFLRFSPKMHPLLWAPCR